MATSTSSGIAETLTASVDSFRVEGQPSDTDIFKIVEFLQQQLYKASGRYDTAEGKHNLVGIIMNDTSYAASYGSNFVTPARLGAYDENIPDDAQAVVRAKAEAIHKAKLHDYGVFVEANAAIREFLLQIIDDVFVAELMDPVSFYSKVAPRKILEHLQQESEGRHEIDAVQVTVDMVNMHNDARAETVVMYIQLQEELQKKASRITDGSIVIPNAMLLSYATNAMLATQQFPRANELWNEKPKNDKTWENWKRLYTEHERLANVNKRASGGRDKFGAANSATHGNKPADIRGGGARQSVSFESSPQLLEQMEDMFDNFANAATTDGTVLAELVKTNAVLTKINSELTTTVDKLTKTNADLVRKVGSGGGGGGSGGGSGSSGGSALRDKFPSGKRDKPEKCVHCGKTVMHKDEDCYELAKNAHLRPKNFKSVKEE